MALKKTKTRLLLSLVLLGIFIFGVFLVNKDIPLEQLKVKYTNSSSKFMSLHGMQVHYRDEGKGTPIVLLHGTGSSLHTWDAWTNELSKKYRVIRMDLPGFGLTGPNSQGEYSINTYTNFVKDFIYELQIDNFYLVGNSLGGNIAWNFTSAYPTKIKKLILIDASGYPGRKETPWVFKLARTPVINSIVRYVTPKTIVRKNLEQVYFDDSKVTSILIERYYELTLREDNRQAFIDRAKTSFINNTDKLKNIQTKTLVLWGNEDYWIPKTHAYSFVNDMPNAELFIINNVGHVPMEENPDESLKPLLRFLQKD
ncbi:alpha/beta hydrolase [Aquimarina sp. D1M17]|uniref:alpha/beta fold hydrolase n=1 Tax=Aquimarina acroporae TaxID=2937283 RepID=UPI0020BE0ACC|nr:alpha/beta hydrolase [Aquimarina acroporae]MCK8520360.1 alpha/beta hydrolase [Aquimarina acroporae]